MKLKNICVICALIAALALLLYGCTNSPEKNDKKQPEKATDALSAESTKPIEEPESPSNEEKDEDINDFPVDAIEIPTLSAPSEESIAQITSDYTSYLHNELGVSSELSPYVYVTRYYGSYNGAVPVKIESMGIRFNTTVWEEDIAGFSFRYYDGNLVKVWNDGAFCTLREAFDSGLLTREEIYIISELHRDRLFIEMNMDWSGNQFDNAKYAVSSMLDVQKEVIAEFLNKDMSEVQWIDPMDFDSILTDGIRCYGHFGKGSFIFIPTESETETTKEILGFTFTHPTSFEMYFVHRDTVMSLEDAYDAGYFDLNTIAAVEHNHIVTAIYNERIANERLLAESNDYSDIIVEKPTEEIKYQLRSELLLYLQENDNVYPNTTVDEFDPYVRYYGNIDGVTAINTGGWQLCWEHDTDVEVAGVIFHHFSAYYEIEIWHEGGFYSLEDAYEMGIVSAEQLAKIAHVHNENKFAEINGY